MKGPGSQGAGEGEIQEINHEVLKMKPIKALKQGEYKGFKIGNTVEVKEQVGSRGKLGSERFLLRKHNKYRPRL